VESEVIVSQSLDLPQLQLDMLVIVHLPPGENEHGRNYKVAKVVQLPLPADENSSSSPQVGVIFYDGNSLGVYSFQQNSPLQLIDFENAVVSLTLTTKNLLRKKLLKQLAKFRLGQLM
jgi:hypothetical protein